VVIELCKALKGRSRLPCKANYVPLPKTDDPVVASLRMTVFRASLPDLVLSEAQSASLGLGVRPVSCAGPLCLFCRYWS
jgi:hypothetical protein